MRFMVIVKANAQSESGQPPDEHFLKEMNDFNEELVKARVMFAGEGLHPSKDVQEMAEYAEVDPTGEIRRKEEELRRTIEARK